MPRNGGGKNTRKQTKINVSTTTASTNVLLCLYCSLAVALLLPCCCLAVALQSLMLFWTMLLPLLPLLSQAFNKTWWENW